MNGADKLRAPGLLDTGDSSLTLRRLVANPPAAIENAQAALPRDTLELAREDFTLLEEQEFDDVDTLQHLDVANFRRDAAPLRYYHGQGERFLRRFECQLDARCERFVRRLPYPLAPLRLAAALKDFVGKRGGRTIVSAQSFNGWAAAAAYADHCAAGRACLAYEYAFCAETSLHRFLKRYVRSWEEFSGIQVQASSLVDQAAALFDRMQNCWPQLTQVLDEPFQTKLRRKPRLVRDASRPNTKRPKLAEVPKPTGFDGLFDATECPPKDFFCDTPPEMLSLEDDAGGKGGEGTISDNQKSGGLSPDLILTTQAPASPDELPPFSATTSPEQLAICDDAAEKSAAASSDFEEAVAALFSSKQNEEPSETEEEGDDLFIPVVSLLSQALGESECINSSEAMQTFSLWRESLHQYRMKWRDGLLRKSSAKPQEPLALVLLIGRLAQLPAKYVNSRAWARMFGLCGAEVSRSLVRLQIELAGAEGSDTFGCSAAEARRVTQKRPRSALELLS